MKSWYKKSQTQQNFGFYDEMTPTEAPVPQEIINAPKSISMLEELIEDCENYDSTAKVLQENGFDWRAVDLPDGEKMIVIEIENKEFLIPDFYYPELKEAEEWIDSIWEHELYSYLPPAEEEDFWKDVGDGFVVYHATQPENYDDIMKRGLEEMDKTRGISNRSTGSAVFTSEYPDGLDSYGDLLFEIDVGAMKRDGYMPSVSRETPVEENQTRERLAHFLGVSYTPSDGHSSEGIFDTTLIFYGRIPPKYLSVA